MSRWPTTRLGRAMRSERLESLLEQCDEVNLRQGTCAELYFDKNPDNFNMILDMYRLGQFHIVEAGTQELIVLRINSHSHKTGVRSKSSGCAMVMQRDFEYWGIDELLIESCCSLKYFPQLDVCQNEKIGDEEAKRKAEEKMKREDFGNSKLGRLRSWMWETIEYPWTSSVAQYLGNTLLNVKFNSLLEI